MTKQLPQKRKYDSSKRQARALETQAQIIEAAKELFIRNGYTKTTIIAIAKEAGVAPETIYSMFGNKSAILTGTMNGFIPGDGNPVPEFVRASIQEVESERNQNRQIQLFAQRMRRIMEQSASLIEVLRVASKTEADMESLLNKYLQGRFQGMGYFIDCLLANGPLRSRMDKLNATETLWTLTSAEVYTLLVSERGWSADEYEIWLAETLTRLLLP